MDQKSLFPDLVPDQEDKYKYSWVARKPCGCIVAAMIDYQLSKNDIAEIGSWTVGGYKVERVLSGEVKIGWGCNCHKEPPLES